MIHFITVFFFKTISFILIVFRLRKVFVTVDCWLFCAFVYMWFFLSLIPNWFFLSIWFFDFFLFYHHVLFYTLKLFYDYYSVDMNIYWKIISMTHQFCWLIQKQKPTRALKRLKGDIEAFKGNPTTTTKIVQFKRNYIVVVVFFSCVFIAWNLFGFGNWCEVNVAHKSCAVNSNKRRHNVGEESNFQTLCSCLSYVKLLNTILHPVDFQFFFTWKKKCFCIFLNESFPELMVDSFIKFCSLIAQHFSFVLNGMISRVQ